MNNSSTTNVYKYYHQKEIKNSAGYMNINFYKAELHITFMNLPLKVKIWKYMKKNPTYYNFTWWMFHTDLSYQQRYEVFQSILLNKGCKEQNFLIKQKIVNSSLFTEDNSMRWSGSTGLPKLQEQHIPSS